MKMNSFSINHIFPLFMCISNILSHEKIDSATLQTKSKHTQYFISCSLIQSSIQKDLKYHITLHKQIKIQLNFMVS